MNREDMLAEARAMPAKVRLEEYGEVVQELRTKGFTWREVADFLTQRGVSTDHTRVYRMYGQGKQQRGTERRSVEIAEIRYVGERLTKKKRIWNIFEVDLPSKLGPAITLIGYVWGSGAPQFLLGAGKTVSYRDATLVIKTGSSFPMAYIKAEFLLEGESWSMHEVYIVPKWESLI